ncbi:MAG: hypothetical protein ACI9OE_000592 [Mariniflexile sp.]|jgi:hypothetical protein
MKDNGFSCLFLLLFLNFSAYSQCNSSNDLCNKRYDEIAYLTTHNAFNSAVEGFPFLPNQTQSVNAQLNAGVRGLMLDVYDDNGTSMVYHGYAFIGSKPLSNFLNTIKTFLDNNPNEIVTIILECYTSANAIENEMNGSGLSGYLYTHPELTSWPTLQTMINNNKRLVIFSDQNDASPSQGWYHYVWDEAFENPYSAANSGEFSCQVNRGNGSNDLFILNNFITPANATDAQTVNTNPYFLNRVQQCQQERGKFPNFITVDFSELGDALAVVNQLNALNPGSGGGGNPPGNGSDNTDPKILQIKNGAKIIIKGSASLNLKGCVLNPSVDHVLTSDNTVIRKLTPIGSAPNASLARVYLFSSPTADFQGKIIYYYDNVDLGNATHNDLVLQVKNDTDLWMSYADEDTNDNKITYTYTNPTKISSITASASASTLAITVKKEVFKISVYPNPVTSQLQIQYEGDLKTTVFDFVGRKLLDTKLKTIDMSSMPNGIYIIQTTDSTTNKKNSYKIVKK